MASDIDSDACTQSQTSDTDVHSAPEEVQDDTASNPPTTSDEVTENSTADLSDCGSKLWDQLRHIEDAMYLPTEKVFLPAVGCMKTMWDDGQHPQRFLSSPVVCSMLRDKYSLPVFQ